MAEFLVQHKKKKKNEGSIAQVEVNQYNITGILVNWSETTEGLTCCSEPNVRCSLRRSSPSNTLFLVINIELSTLSIHEMLME